MDEWRLVRSAPANRQQSPSFSAQNWLTLTSMGVCHFFCLLPFAYVCPYIRTSLRNLFLKFMYVAGESYVFFVMHGIRGANQVNPCRSDWNKNRGQNVVFLILFWLYWQCLHCYWHLWHSNSPAAYSITIREEAYISDSIAGLNWSQEVVSCPRASTRWQCVASSQRASHAIENQSSPLMAAIASSNWPEGRQWYWPAEKERLWGGKYVV